MAQKKAWWGWLGLIILIFFAINLILKLQPFALLYFPIIILGYILFVDGLVYLKKGKSRISCNCGGLWAMAALSPIIWWLYEFINMRLLNFSVPAVVAGSYYALFSIPLFATIMPAFFETLDLVKLLFDYEETAEAKKIPLIYLHSVMIPGMILFILTLAKPLYLFPLVWISVFLAIDPINYIRKQPSLIARLYNKDFKIYGLITFSAIILGGSWMIWNFLAGITYTITLLGAGHPLLTPILELLCYHIPSYFAVYSIYYFVKSLFTSE